jgi:hypothetical protein
MASAAQLKKNFLKWTGIGVGGLVAIVTAWMFMPYTGTLSYGICKAFLEQNEPYPSLIKPYKVDEYPGYVSIFYKRTDSFGYESMNTLECAFESDENGNPLYTLKKVDMNGKNRKYPLEDEANLKKFNVGVSALVANPPDLTLPWYPMETLSDLKVD